MVLLKLTPPFNSIFIIYTSFESILKSKCGDPEGSPFYNKELVDVGLCPITKKMLGLPNEQNEVATAYLPGNTAAAVSEEYK